MKSGKTKYDVFISHRSLNRRWVKSLARNLVSRGYRVFLDVWELVPGRPFIEAISEALQQSRKGILVATPEAVESGWVRVEYEALLARSREEPDFSFIPLVFGEIPELPFLATVQCVDFRDPSPSAYRSAFHKLLCGLEDKSPGSDGSTTGDLELPEPISPVRTRDRKDLTSLKTSEAILLDEVFDSAGAMNPILVVLWQAYRGQHDLIDGIKRRAHRKFSQENVLHITPPYSQKADNRAYFEYLGRQCGFSGRIDSSNRWEDELHKRLTVGERVFLLASGFENGSKIGRQKVAEVLRGLAEAHGQKLQVVLCGGERLAELKYEMGELSLLKGAAQLDWPDANSADVLIRQLHDFPGLGFGEAEAEALLKVCGGHPWLIHYCLQELQSGIPLDGVYSSLRKCHFIWQLFTPFRTNTDAREKMCLWLDQADLGVPVQPWPSDPLLRRLYWNNLLVNRSERYSWRCEAIRDVGREVLSCSE